MRGHSLVELTEHHNSAADIIVHTMYIPGTKISSEFPPPLECRPPKNFFGRNGYKNVELSRFFFLFFFKDLPPIFELTPGGSFFAKKNARPRGEHRKIGSIPFDN